MFPDNFKISESGNCGKIVVRLENTKKGAPAVLRPHAFASLGSVCDLLCGSLLPALVLFSGGDERKLVFF